MADQQTGAPTAADPDVDPASDPAPGPDGTTGAEPWRAWSAGQRVVVRRRLPAGSPQPYTDVLGDLLAVDTGGVTVRTRRHGDVRVPADEIAIGKVVPPAPPRRPRPAPAD
ncbi:MAG TPA: hypothetical protein VGC57_02365 [Cellulomonas sp.]